MSAVPDSHASGWPHARSLGPDGPLVFGIVNVTPDSFSDGGEHAHTEAAVAHGVRLWREGADVLDVGGESTRPGADPVPPEVEAARVVPVIEGLMSAIPRVVVSVDTRRATVARAAIAAGAALVNDVSAGDDPAMAGVVASTGVGWILMHMRGTPETMQHVTEYGDLLAEVAAGLAARVAAAEAAGVSRDRLMVDPGVGFGKAWEDNPRLIAAARSLAPAGIPVMIGASRKRFIGAITGIDTPSERIAGSLGAACAACAAGADAVRVHDVGPTIQALQVFLACGRG